MASILEQNLTMLALKNKDLAESIHATEPREGVEWMDTKEDGYPTIMLTEVDDEGRARKVGLSTKFKPKDEALRFAQKAELEKHGAILVLGFGLGYHVLELLRKVKGKGLVIVYEPDMALLRMVLEKIDHRETLVYRELIFLAGDIDDGTITGQLERYIPIIGQGVQIMGHPTARSRSVEAFKQFSEYFTQFIHFGRTTLATTLAHAWVTCRNLSNNLGHYSAGDTVNDLYQCAKGKPALVISAGPSLAKNVHLVKEHNLREKAVIICAQTVLKPMLARGIRPHFVTALDYHEINRRFYEGLPSLDDVTLVAEPKANKVILDSYPGPVRILQNNFLDTLLGDLRRPIQKMKPGGTVAHLSLYLAQHMGCEPIVLIGQDLGFSDGLYYAPGVAIHDVWAPELGIFNTLEMMEWRRVMRHKGHLQKREDIHGRQMYSDEQMLTYANQFNRDFLDATEKIIDATEGGLPKEHVEQGKLAEVIDRYMTEPLGPLPEPEHRLDLDRLRITKDHVKSRLEEIRELRDLSEKTVPLLKKMSRDQDDKKKMREHFRKLDRLRHRVNKMPEVFRLVEELNQVGVFTRAKADREIEARDPKDPYEKQRMQLERDKRNVEWMIEACNESLKLFRDAADRIEFIHESEIVKHSESTNGGTDQ